MNKWLYLVNIHNDQKAGWFMFGPGGVIAFEPSHSGRHTALVGAGGTVLATVMPTLAELSAELDFPAKPE